MHDAILVGIGTAINDDPQLNGNVQNIYTSDYLLNSFLLFFASPAPTPPTPETIPPPQTHYHRLSPPPSTHL